MSLLPSVDHLMYPHMTCLVSRVATKVTGSSIHGLSLYVPQPPSPGLWDQLVNLVNYIPKNYCVSKIIYSSS